ncbi:MAG: helix-turn-helix domain-containing protein [Acidimicrobiales bacterium]
MTPRLRNEPSHELTPHERSVATLVVSGMSNPEVAAELIVNVKTVEYHLHNIFTKLDVTSRGRLAAKLAYQPAHLPRA